MLFISPRFLFPMDTGGQIRTGQILRHLHNRHFEITLLCPATAQQECQYADEIKKICQTFISFRPAPRHGFRGKFKRAASLLDSLPVSIVSDISSELRRLIAGEQDKGYAVVVYDFIHAAVNFVDPASAKTVVFTHNVEHEIYKRHAAISNTPWRHAIWQAQYEKMKRFEETALRWFDRIIAVSEKDGAYFQTLNPRFDVKVIPTGVDLEFFRYSLPRRSKEIIFVGSMDYWSNIEGVAWFLRKILDAIKRKHPEATVKIIGRYPPASLLKEFADDHRIRFTGWVNDIHQEAKNADVYVVPLRVGSGTRIKIFEAMAMGIPVVSTSIGVEGLPVIPYEHYLAADSAEAFVEAIDTLFSDISLCRRLAHQARRLMEENFSWGKVAADFAEFCRFPSMPIFNAAEAEAASANLGELADVL